jgi:hypothetical protein
MVEVHIKRFFSFRGGRGLEGGSVGFLLVTSVFNTPVKSDCKFGETSLVNSVIVNFLDTAPTKLCHSHGS